MPVTTCRTNMNSSRLPNAEVQRDPPLTGSSNTCCFNSRQPVREPKKPGWPRVLGFSRIVLLIATPSVAGSSNRASGLDLHWNPLGRADAEVLPTHPKVPVTNLGIQAVHSSRGRTADKGSFLAEDSAVTRTTEFRGPRRPRDRTTQMGTERREDPDFARGGRDNKNPDRSRLTRFCPTVLPYDFNGKQRPCS